MQKSVIYLSLAILGIISIVTNLATGSINLSFLEIYEILKFPNHHPQAQIIWQIRLPRALLSFLCGSVLSVGGVYMQTLVRNPLADPYIMGVTAGAGLGVNLWVTGILSFAIVSVWTIPLIAWIGGMLSLLLAVGIGWRSFAHQQEKFLLSGVATSSLCTALTGILIYKYSQHQQAAQMLFWTLGSFEKANWQGVGISAMLTFIMLCWGWMQAGKLDILLLGHGTAQSLGLSVARFHLILLLITSFCVGGMVGFTGPVGFVGMMIPHISRKWVGGLHRNLLICSWLLGGLYLSSCDTFSRYILPPVGLPIGIVTALVGVPFFLYLLHSPKSSAS